MAEADGVVIPLTLADYVTKSKPEVEDFAELNLDSDFEDSYCDSDNYYYSDEEESHDE